MKKETTSIKNEVGSIKLIKKKLFNKTRTTVSIKNEVGSIKLIKKIAYCIFIFFGNIKSPFSKKMPSKRFYERLRGIFFESFPVKEIVPEITNQLPMPSP